MPDRPDVEIAVLKTQIAYLTQQMETLNDRLEEVIELMNRSRGALWAAMLFASAGTVAIGGIAGFIAWVVSLLKH